MASRAFAIAIPLLAALKCEAQQLRELLEDVEPSRAAQLQDYNSTFLQQQTYFASRYRIVKADVGALLEERDVTITPFDDIEPIGLVFDRLEHYRTSWKGFYQNDPLFQVTGERFFLVTISMFAWEVTESGTAIPSRQDRGTFFSVSAVLDVPGDSKYVLEPLKYTPRYSVVYEIPRNSVMPIRIDVVPGDPPLSAEEQVAWEEYRDFIERLPDERDKRVLADIM